MQLSHKGGSVAYVLDDKGFFKNNIVSDQSQRQIPSVFIDETRHQPIIMQWSRKKQIARAIYEENLVVVGREVPKYRRKRIVPRRHHRPTVIALSLIVGAAVVYSAISLSRGKSDKSVVASTAMASQSGIALAMVNPAEATRDGNGSVTHAGTSPSANTAITHGQTSDSKTTLHREGLSNVTAQGKDLPGIDDTMDHLLHDVPVPKTQDPLIALNNIHAYKGLTNTKTPLARLFGLGVRTIVIDPGHGGKDPGAIGQNGTDEKDVALAIALRLRDRLKRFENFDVYMTRDKDVYVPLKERVNFANTIHADLFVSIHTNSFPSENMNFIETYYFGPNNDSKVTRLAETENRDSDFVYAQFREMLQNISDTMKFQESKKLAAAVQSTLYTNMRKLNAKAHNHGIKPAPFVVLLGLDSPSILTEVSNLSDKREEKRLNTPRYRDKIAKFLENGIVSYLNKVTSDKNSATVTKTGGRGNAPEKEKLAKEETR